ncbi:MAG TPA: SIS domain-containing protein, partial [Levilinea sp.]|nr:SIS domain-containing protein [Levilinea sp.]
MQVNGRKTQREIMSQPHIWKEVIKGFAGRKPNLAVSGGDFDQIFFTGCGSTYYLSIWAARAVQERFGYFSRPLPTSELW